MSINVFQLASLLMSAAAIDHSTPVKLWDPVKAEFVPVTGANVEEREGEMFVCINAEPE